MTIDQPDKGEEEELDLADLPDQMAKVKVSTLVHDYLKAQNLGVLPERAMERAVEEYVEKGDKDALSKSVPISPPFVF